MKTWALHMDEYLDEVLRLEGRGSASISSTCGGCGTADPTFRCSRQMCYGPGLFCEKCIMEKHSVLPTHWVEEWNGSFFQRRSLHSLGLVMQLGHPPGYSCTNSTPAHVHFTVIDVTGVHPVCVRFCNCDSRVEHRQQLMRVCWWPATARDPQTCATFAVVRLFQIMNCLGKLSAHDFLRSLELLTNNDGLDLFPKGSRRRAFRHIVCQYRIISMMKRAGRGHALSGTGGTAQGELAVRCRACPQDGRNLPQGWQNINWAAMPEDLRYKYFLFLAQDCNFRLISRNISSAANDLIIGDGLGYFVNNALYTDFLRNHVSEEEISTCSGFQAMFLSNKKRIKGLQCNMDFILFSALLNSIIFYLILSYDVACQYSKNFWTRMDSLPEPFRLFIDRARVWFKVPNFHLPGHSPFSFHYMWGAGRTHGETIEQNWEFTNRAAASTKMMGIGTRHSTLEDLFGFHNWRRLVSWRGIFMKRMGENVKEGQIHRDTFNTFDQALRETVPEMVEKWKAWVADWESRQHTDGTELPFEVRDTVMSMQEIRLKLAREELLRSGEGVEVEREDTPSTFILLGLGIEESQRYLAIDVKAVANPTEQQSLDFLKRHTALLKRIRTFRRLQRTYMPHLRRYLAVAQREQLETEGDREAESIRLLMPSEITDKTKRERACTVGLPAVEGELRIGEAREALEVLRAGLQTRTMTNRYRLRNCTGQRALTRGQGVLRQINMKIHKAKLRYRYVQNALLRLKGHGSWEKELQVLNDGDVRALNERALTEEEAAQRQSIHDYEDVAEEGGVASFGMVALGESRRTLLWIWYSTKAGEPTEAELVEALRVEWCKAYARARRWPRHTIEYGYWSALEWRARAATREDVVGPELREGLCAYSMEQAQREERTCEELKKRWAPVRERGRAYLARESAAWVEIRLPRDDDGDDGEDSEEEAPDYADEGDDEVEE
ncbi:hypothetical protein DFH07DRAFT_865230 [Mycena maculata]|uniref:CxC2-like cysteine cluster KDZ transposase-associated domain-containing protein n=1 Tax=Mycena maculata TaxID=230809 RepID=A0AAD7KB01_9AGAR|nr:hypothetical protein DFH07DRAFT_865230 [Mycena maculata]